ncbi:MAG: ABC transporter substrate-binding protein, partial [Flavobacteriaceae bacterium]|nr:ABC transporter substrate-binding protein [Flavobacteriaceae bacterium]
LMAYVSAQNNEWDLEKDLNFEVIRNLDGAIEGLTSGKADYFLWEKFTTKPIVDSGTFRRVGECPTPWPCFVVAVRESFIEENMDELNTILSIINQTTAEFKQIPSIDRMIANRYNQSLDDVKEWLSLTEWSTDQIKDKTVENVQRQLKALRIISETRSYKDLVLIR